MLSHRARYMSAHIIAFQLILNLVTFTAYYYAFFHHPLISCSLILNSLSSNVFQTPIVYTIPTE
jgi:hypothetical protein